MNLLADSALLIMVFIHVSKSIIMSYKHFHNKQQIFEVDTVQANFINFFFQAGQMADWWEIDQSWAAY